MPQGPQADRGRRAGARRRRGRRWWLAHASVPTDDGLLTLRGDVDTRQVSLAFEPVERIVERLAREGDHVAAGQVPARLDTRTARLRLAQADAQV